MYILFIKNKYVGLTRIELVTSTLSVWRSNQLSYKPIVVLMGGLEPPTSILSGLPSKPTDIHQDESF